MRGPATEETFSRYIHTEVQRGRGDGVVLDVVYEARDIDPAPPQLGGDKIDA